MVVDTELYNRFGVFPDADDYEIHNLCSGCTASTAQCSSVLRGVIHACFEKVAQLAGV
jgi:hypothetical protein